MWILIGIIRSIWHTVCQFLSQLYHAAQLQQGVPVLTILDKIRDGDIESLGHEHLITGDSRPHIQGGHSMKVVT